VPIPPRNRDSLRSPRSASATYHTEASERQPRSPAPRLAANGGIVAAHVTGERWAEPTFRCGTRGATSVHTVRPTALNLPHGVHLEQRKCHTGRSVQPGVRLARWAAGSWENAPAVALADRGERSESRFRGGIGTNYAHTVNNCRKLKLMNDSKGLVTHGV
jgi:hypothetical protein